VVSLEINSSTARFTPKLVESCGFKEQIEIIECDATKVELQGLNADILVSENLSNGLFDEPQYQIINHLSRFMKPEGNIVPSRAELFVSLATADWEGIDKPNIAARKLKDFKRLTPMSKYFEVKSTVGLDLKEINGSTQVDFRNSDGRANVLLISTRYQIDEGQNPVFLEPDTANFLGKSSAFRLQSEIEGGGLVNVNLRYPVGMPRKFSVINEGNKIISLTAPEGYKG
jgi:hypothetical protein